MSLLDSIDAGAFMTALGWTLLNFIWQGALIAAVVAAALRVLGDGNARVRYAACCAGLVAMMAAPPVTLVVILASRSVPVPAPVDVLALAVAPTGTQAWLAAVLPQLAAIWIFGVVLLQTRLLVQWLAAQRMRRHGVVPARAPWPATVNELCARIGIRRTVAIVESTVAQVPMVIGWLQPVILIPAGLVTGFTQHQLRAIIAHELAHVRRHDYLVNLIQAVLETLLFYHPAVWWLSNRLRVEREYCCDDVAVTVGGDAMRYARTLTLLETIRSETPQPAIASTGGTLMTRIQRLLGVQSGTPGSTGWMAPAAITLAVVTACSALALARPIHGEKHPDHAHPHGHDTDVAFSGDAPHDVDVVRVLREAGSEDAAFFEMLREAGLDNKTMMMILEKMGPDEKVRHALQSAEKRAMHLELRLVELHEQLAKNVDAGRMTNEEATRKFHVVLEELKQDLRPTLIDEAHREMGAIKKRLADQVAAGEITDAQAEELADRAHEELKARMLENRRAEYLAMREYEAQLHAIGKKLKDDVAAGLISETEAKVQYERALHEYGRQKRAGNARFPDPAVAERLHKLHDEVRADLEAGRITEKEAEQRIHAAAQRLHELMAVREGKLRERMPDSMRARLEALHEEIRAALEEGLITEQEAHDRMRAAKLELHEQLRAEMAERHERKRRHHDD